jgi:hypothetical protein
MSSADDTGAGKSSQDDPTGETQGASSEGTVTSVGESTQLQYQQQPGGIEPGDMTVGSLSVAGVPHILNENPNMNSAINSTLSTLSAVGAIMNQDPRQSDASRQESAYSTPPSQRQYSTGSYNSTMARRVSSEDTGSRRIRKRPMDPQEDLGPMGPGDPLATTHSAARRISSDIDSRQLHELHSSSLTPILKKPCLSLSTSDSLDPTDASKIQRTAPGDSPNEAHIYSPGGSMRRVTWSTRALPVTTEKTSSRSPMKGDLDALPQDDPMRNPLHKKKRMSQHIAAPGEEGGDDEEDKLGSLTTNTPPGGEQRNVLWGIRTKPSPSLINAADEALGAASLNRRTVVSTGKQQASVHPKHSSTGGRKTILKSPLHEPPSPPLHLDTGTTLLKATSRKAESAASLGLRPGESIRLPEALPQTPPDHSGIPEDTETNVLLAKRRRLQRIILKAAKKELFFLNQAKVVRGFRYQVVKKYKRTESTLQRLLAERESLSAEDRTGAAAAVATSGFQLPPDYPRSDSITNKHDPDPADRARQQT